MKTLNIISSPRNISTALMYSFAHRTDTEVVDEPFYAVYFIKTGIVHPGREEVLKEQPHNEEDVLKDLFGVHNKPVFFIKNMAHHLEVLESFPFEHCENIFLIRNPKQIIASYAQVIDLPVMRDIGIEYQYNLFERLKALGQNPLVLDSGLLLENPEAVLTNLCHNLKIPFERSMLTWAAGPKPYDGVWAPYWYANVHKSTGFEKQPTSERPLPEHLTTLYLEAKKYYEKLLPFALRP
ncbi:MAG: sulfotransferase family protein [Cyclobacteriaceae bacterium]|nr:sulfotransferase family protein [Cyclobacteriaceae bacterium]UYN86104.1 MAG: sulfotransferase family protein [Cyclobacteriaceae bacterium]